MIACEAGLTPSEFWDLSWRELDAVLIGHRNRQESEWRYTREMVAELRNIFSALTTKAGRRIKTYTGAQMIPLESDNVIIKEVRKSTYTDFINFCERMNIPLNMVN